jgi:hypothetical protein
LDEYEQYIREKYITQIDERGKNEMFGFVYNEDSKMIAQL